MRYINTGDSVYRVQKHSAEVGVIKFRCVVTNANVEVQRLSCCGVCVKCSHIHQCSVPVGAVNEDSSEITTFKPRGIDTHCSVLICDIPN